jgi:hypothetical protein
MMPLARLRVERAGRLVGPDYRWVVYEGAGDGDALLLAAAHLRRALVRLLREADHLQRIEGPPAGLFLLFAGDQERQLHVLHRGEDRYQVVRLEDEPHLLRPKARPLPVGHPPDGVAVDPDLAVGEVVEAGEDVEERRLAAPGRAHDGDHLPAGYAEVHAPERPHPQAAGLVDLLHAGRLDHQVRAVYHSISSPFESNRLLDNHHGLLRRFYTTPQTLSRFPKRRIVREAESG